MQLFSLLGSNAAMANGGAAMGDSGMQRNMAASDPNYPICSASVTDHCRERSNAAGARVHSRRRG